MSLLYPGIDDEDAMRWYENIHSMPQYTEAPPTTDTITDLPVRDQWTPPPLHPDDPLYKEAKGLLGYYGYPEYDSGDTTLHGSDPGPFYAIDDPTYLKEVGGFDMQTAEGYEAYLNSL